MSLSFLNTLDWDEFNSRYPGAWCWLQMRVLLRELERLEAAASLSPPEARRLVELSTWFDVMRRAEARP